MVMQNNFELGEGLIMPTDPHHTPTILQPSSSQPQKTQKPRKPIRKDTYVPQLSGLTDNVVDEVVYKELGDSLVRAATSAFSLEAEQDSGNITKTQSNATPNESRSQGTNLGGGPKCQETMRDTTAQTRFESVSKRSNDSLLIRGNTLQTKTTQCNEIDSLKRRVKKRYKSLGEDASKQGRKINAIDSNDEITLVNDVDNEMFDVDDLGGEKAKGIVFHKSGKSTITTPTISSQQSQDKGKGIMIEEPVKPKKKDQIRRDEEATLKLQAEFAEEERLARERVEIEKEANIALIETQDDIQAKIDADRQLAERLQAQEQEELSEAEKATLFQQLLEKKESSLQLKEAFKMVNTFEDIRTELVKEKEKRAREELIQESIKKQKMEDDKEKAKLKQLMETIPDE
nr:hypothetical protein [Tanacetum cinerariifolium]